MNCLAIRERLPEHAMSLLDAREAEAVERHLQWCAGCRKEASELGDAAATFGLSLAPAPPPPELEERVVRAVSSARGNPGRGPRRGRSAAALAVAAMVAVAGLGWGAVMAGQADRERDEAARLRIEQRRADLALERFRDVLAGEALRFVPRQDTVLVRLGPTPGRDGGGAALILASPTLIDFAIVIVKGLPEAGAPYRVALENGSGASLKVGDIARGDLDVDGGAEVYRDVNRDLISFTRIVVSNAAGAIVLQGEAGSGSPAS